MCLEVYVCVFMGAFVMYVFVYACVHAYVCGFSLVCVCDRHYLMQISQCTQIAGCVSKADRQMNLIC